MGEPDGERLARLEEGVRYNNRRLDGIEENQGRLEGKVDQLLQAFYIGQGGAKVAAKIGGLVVLAIGALAWLWQNVIGPLFRGHP